MVLIKAVTTKDIEWSTGIGFCVWYAVTSLALNAAGHFWSQSITPTAM